MSQEPDRRMQFVLTRSELHSLLGLPDDQKIVLMEINNTMGYLQVVVESPEFEQLDSSCEEPHYLTLPVRAA